jgi:hypothetical protein
LLNLVKLAFTLVLGAAIGLGATYLSVGRGLGFGAIHARAWTVWPRIGSNDVDPYARAALARSGQIPLGLAEGLMYVAQTDDKLEALSSRCSYRISGPMPTGRYWTLTPNTADGFLIDNPVKRYGFTSREIVRDSDGDWQIVVSPAANAGNWLPIGDIGHFILVLRIYDTTLSATASTLEPAMMPSIVREHCP